MIFLFLLAILANAEMDRIKNKKGLFKSEWWNNNLWENRNWFVKYPFSFLLDGWHFCKSIMLMSFCLLIAGNILFAVILYTVFGIVFNLIYHRK
jgi:hypothetical protein